MKRLAFFCFALILTACEKQEAGDAVARARIDGKAGEATPAPIPSPEIASQVESACRSVIFENTSLTHCLAVPSRHRIVTDLGPDGSAPWRSLSRLAENRSNSGIAFAINGGMYDNDGNPVGYYVEDSERLQTLNTNDGTGNFHMKPNGVFFGSSGEWQVRSTDYFLANVTDRPEFGTQSGPMLVIDGELHPEFSEDGTSRLVRNAVGVDERGRAHFVISNAPISFGKLARFYRDELAVKNALFLDANVSALWNPSTDRLDTGAPIGPIIVIEKKGAAE